MIVCDKCGSLIEEKPPEEPKDEQPEDEIPKRSRYKKEAPKEETPTRRTSLVNLPYKYGVNCYERQDFDLCEGCKRFLDKALDKIRFEFITTPVNREGEIT